MAPKLALVSTYFGHTSNSWAGRLLHAGTAHPTHWVHGYIHGTLLLVQRQPQLRLSLITPSCCCWAHAVAKQRIFDAVPGRHSLSAGTLTAPLPRAGVGVGGAIRGACGGEGLQLLGPILPTVGQVIRPSALRRVFGGRQLRYCYQVITFYCHITTVACQPVNVKLAQATGKFPGAVQQWVGRRHLHCGLIEQLRACHTVGCSKTTQLN
jgi:hypothetical protein